MYRRGLPALGGPLSDPVTASTLYSWPRCMVMLMSLNRAGLVSSGLNEGIAMYDLPYTVNPSQKYLDDIRARGLTAERYRRSSTHYADEAACYRRWRRMWLDIHWMESLSHEMAKMADYLERYAATGRYY